jgi:hypothetical protein
MPRSMRGAFDKQHCFLLFLFGVSLGKFTVRNDEKRLLGWQHRKLSVNSFFCIPEQSKSLRRTRNSGPKVGFAAITDDEGFTFIGI